MAANAGSRMGKRSSRGTAFAKTIKIGGAMVFGGEGHAAMGSDANLDMPNSIGRT